MQDNAEVIYDKISPSPVPRAVVFNPVCLSNPVIPMLVALFIFILCASFVGLISFTASIWGINARAQVNSYKTIQVKHRDMYRYYVDISYPYPQNTYRVNIDADWGLYKMASHKNNLEARYFAAFPQYPHLEGSNDALGSISIFVFLLIMVPVTWQMIRSLYLIKTGVPLIGKVIKVWSGRHFIHRKISYNYEGRGLTTILVGSNDDTDSVLLFADKTNPENAICYGEYVQWKIRGL